jgi:hypothetical protein
VLERIRSDAEASSHHEFVLERIRSDSVSYGTASRVHVFVLVRVAEQRSAHVPGAGTGERLAALISAGGAQVAGERFTGGDKATFKGNL